jgi:hypothetical protein
MSEFTGTRCDGCGKLTEVEAIDVVDELQWEEDDMGGHACPDCQQRAADLEANAADGADLATFGEALTATAEAVLESPEVIKLKQERLEAFQKIKKDTLKAIRKDMKSKGLAESEIDEVLKDVERELDDTYNQKYNFKAEA